jgi:hypothetical protein
MPYRPQVGSTRGNAPSSSDEEMEVRGKGVGRRAPCPAPITKKASRTSSLRRSQTPPKRERSPRRPTTPERKPIDEKVAPSCEEKVQERAPSPGKERSPRRDSKPRGERRESSQGSSGKEPRAKTAYYELGTPTAGSPRPSSCGAIPRNPPGSPSTRTPEPRKPPPSPRATAKGVAETPLPLPPSQPCLRGLNVKS